MTTTTNTPTEKACSLDEVLADIGTQIKELDHIITALQEFCNRGAIITKKHETNPAVLRTQYILAQGIYPSLAKLQILHNAQCFAYYYMETQPELHTMEAEAVEDFFESKKEDVGKINTILTHVHKKVKSDQT